MVGFGDLVETRIAPVSTKTAVKVSRVVEFLRHSCLKTNSDMSAEACVAKISEWEIIHTLVLFMGSHIKVGNKPLIPDLC